MIDFITKANQQTFFTLETKDDNYLLQKICLQSTQFSNTYFQKIYSKTQNIHTEKSPQNLFMAKNLQNMSRKVIFYFFLLFCFTFAYVSSCDHSGNHHEHTHEQHGNRNDHNQHDHHDHQGHAQNDHSHAHNRPHTHHHHDQSQGDNTDHHRSNRYYHHNHASADYKQNKHAQQGQQKHTSRTKQQPKSLQFKMIENKPHLLQSLKLRPISVFFYGSVQTPQYQQFESMLPEYNSEFIEKLSNQVEFYFIPSDKFNLTRPNPSLSIYRKINNGEWLMYKGIFQKHQIKNWILNNTVDPLRELTGQEIESLFIDEKKGFILLDFGQFHLLKPKIMLNQFCQEYELLCGKVTHTNRALNMVIQLMRVQKQPGVPKLGYWNPKTQQLEIYTKELSLLTQNELMQLYSGHESVIRYEAQMDVAEAIHPETQFIEMKQYKENLEL